MLAEVSAFFAKIPLNEHLWDLLVTYSKTEEAKKLTPVRKRALDESMEGFIQAGADLPPEKKKRVEEIESELSKLTQKYSENVLDSTNKWELVIDDVNRSKGCRRPPSKPRAPMPPRKDSARPEKPVYRLTLKAPSMIPVMEYLEDEGIRRQVWEGASGIGRMVSTTTPSSSGRFSACVMRRRRSWARRTLPTMCWPTAWRRPAAARCASSKIFTHA
jgi:oligopeptidase A